MAGGEKNLGQDGEVVISSPYQVIPAPRSTFVIPAEAGIKFYRELQRVCYLGFDPRLRGDDKYRLGMTKRRK